MEGSVVHSLGSAVLKLPGAVLQAYGAPQTLQSTQARNFTPSRTNPSIGTEAEADLQYIYIHIILGRDIPV